MIVNHWVRIVMNREIKAFFDGLPTDQLDAFEISGSNWSGIEFKSYESKWFPEFDICEHTTEKTYDVVIADQVFMCVKDPEAAAKNIMRMLRPGGVFVITVSFLIRYEPMPLDLWRWSQDGLKLFLEKQNFQDVRTLTYDPDQHSLENDPDFPSVVWGFAYKR